MRSSVAVVRTVDRSSSSSFSERTASWVTGLEEGAGWMSVLAAALERSGFLSFRLKNRDIMFGVSVVSSRDRDVWMFVIIKILEWMPDLGGRCVNRSMSWRITSEA